MNNTQKITAALTLSTAVFAGSASALDESLTKPIWSFSNVSVNYLDWSARTDTETQTPFARGKQDFVFLEVEGGAGYSWGEVYGFFDLENPGNSKSRDDGRNTRIATKGTLRYYLGDTGFNVYGHIYRFQQEGFKEENRVIGVGYNYFDPETGFWFKPFLGAHYVDRAHEVVGLQDWNGYMAGWVLGYDFEVAGQKLAVTNWHEYEFDRHEEYMEDENSSINGAVSLWWNATPQVTAGVQYRYADNKLGSTAYQNAMIYTLKYNF